MCKRGFNKLAMRAMAALLSSLATASVVSAQTIYVNGSCGDDAWSASSAVCAAPTGPKSTIQAAIDAAVNGDTVVVADGTYTGPGNRDLDFGGRAITVQGTNGAPNCIIDCQATGRAFHFQSGETEASVLDGFTIRNGLALSGSAILCELASAPTITNCVFTGNHATVVDDSAGALACLASSPTIAGCVFQANTTTGFGGAVACANGSEPEFTDCRFEDNTAAWSAGFDAFVQCHLAFTDCLFIQNESEFCCGGGSVYDNCSLQLTRCTFLGNVTGPNGAAGFNVQLNSQADVRDCVFSDNFTTGSSGAVSCLGDSDLIVTNTTFLRNEADRCCGAGYVNNNSSVQLTRCAVLGNVANGPTNGGGGFAVQRNSQADVRDCVFVGNYTADVGTLLCLDDSQLTLTNATFRNNVAVDGTGAVGVYRNANGSANLLNCILWNDTPPEIGLFEAAVTVTYSDIRNGWPGVGNISSDPMFVSNPHPGPDGFWGTPDDNYGDSHLTLGSPCIDAGDSEFLPQPCAHDLDHACRVWDGNADSVVRVDMGAYEFAAPRGDLNGDCEVGLSDLSALLAHFGTPSGATYADGDLDADDDVDLSDLAQLLANFGTTCP